MKVGFVAADRGGSAFYRVIQPYKICQELYEEAFFSQAGKVTYKLIDNSDVILVQRQEDPSAIKGLLDLKAKGKLIMTDIDDNIWSIPKRVTDLKAFWTPERVNGFERTLEICDAVTTSTPLLAKNISAFNKNVYVLPNLVDAFNFSKPKNKAVKIGWGGSATHLPDFTVDIISTLLKLKKEYKNKIELIMVGVVPLDLIGHCTYYRFIEPFKYLSFLRTLNLDIGIIPCANNFFNDARSNVKYLEWGAIKATAIASPATSYVTSITHGVSGFLVRKHKQWYEYLKLLIEDEKLRATVSQNAFDYVYENYSVEKKSKQYNLYKELYEKRNNENFDFNTQ